MTYQNSFIRFFLIASFGLYPLFGIGQQVKNVPEAFSALESDPEVILISNTIEVPTEKGHFQGVQVISENKTEKLLISGSSLTTAYILQVDLRTQKTDKLIPLMQAPFRHAGGIQVSEPYVIVGIEDNFIKTVSKVCLYNYHDADLLKATANMTIDRQGEAEKQTSGATGLLALETNYLAVVSNWDSRNWDFYHIDPDKNEQKLLKSFAAPDDWAAYQAINLIKDSEAIYAIGFYQKVTLGYADLILVSKRGTFEPVLEKVSSKTFNCKKGVDFGTAAGLQVDDQGNLHIWATQRDAVPQIAVNRFSQQPE